MQLVGFGSRTWRMASGWSSARRREQIDGPVSRFGSMVTGSKSRTEPWTPNVVVVLGHRSDVAATTLLPGW